MSDGRDDKAFNTTRTLARSAMDYAVPEHIVMEATAGFAQGITFAKAFPEYAMALCRLYDHSYTPELQSQCDQLRDTQILRWSEIIKDHPIEEVTHA